MSETSYFRFRCCSQSAPQQLLHFLKAVSWILWSLLIQKKTVSAPRGGTRYYIQHHSWYFWVRWNSVVRHLLFSLSYEVWDFINISITSGAHRLPEGTGGISLKGDLLDWTVPLTQQVAWQRHKWSVWYWSGEAGAHQIFSIISSDSCFFLTSVRKFSFLKHAGWILLQDAVSFVIIYFLMVQVYLFIWISYEIHILNWR